jgi:hypothetical protein
MLPEEPMDVPVSPELAEMRNVVRRLEAQLANEHGVDTPAYWRAMSDRLQGYVINNRFAPETGTQHNRASERAHNWLVRVAAAYGALAQPGVRS